MRVMNEWLAEWQANHHHHNDDFNLEIQLLKIDYGRRKKQANDNNNQQQQPTRCFSRTSIGIFPLDSLGRVGLLACLAGWLRTATL